MRPLMRMAPWWRGPALLLRRPGVALALTAATFVVALPAASAPLFLSSARSATLEHNIANDCPTYVGPLIRGNLPFPGARALPERVRQNLPPYGTANYRARTELADRAAGRLAGLGPRTTSLWLTASSTTPAGESINLTLASREGFGRHISVLQGTDPGSAPTAGAWIPDTLTEATGQKTGDKITITALVPTGVPGETTQESRSIPIAGVYRDLRQGPDRPYWCLMKYVYRGEPGTEFSNRVVPPVVLMDADTLLAAGEGMGFNATHAIEYPVVDPEITQPEAARLAAGIDRMRADLNDAEPAVFDGMFPYNVNTTLKADIGKFADRAELVRRSLMPPVLPITAAGIVVGLLVVAAAAIFWIQRRATELRVLAVRGAGPGALGLKAVMEALPALVVGVVAGWLAARGLVAWAGPSPRLSAEAVPLSLAAVAAGLPLAALVLAVTASLGSRHLADHAAPRRHTARIARWPWELLLVAATVPVWLLLGDSRELSGAPGSTGSVAQVPGRLLVVPILVIAGLAAFCAREGVRWLRRHGRDRTPGRPAVFLAWRRTAREALVAATLAAAIAMPVGLAAYGATVTGSVHATLAAEARVRSGADVVLTLRERAPVPDALAGRATEVLRLDGASVNGTQTDVLAVDPATFPRCAFWDDRLDDAPLREIVAGIRSGADAPGEPGTFPAVGSAPLPGGSHEVSWGSEVLGQAEVSTVEILPAAQGGYPVLMIDKAALSGTWLAKARPQLWVRGEPEAILRAAESAGLPLARTTVADDMYANTVFEPLTYTFDYLVALSLLTGVIAVVGLLLYLEGRTPRLRRAYVMLRRMGLRRGAHRRTVLLEVLLPLLAGLAVGVGLAAGTVQALAGAMEINPGLPPDTVVRPPTAALLGIGTAVVVIGVLAAWYAHYRVSSAKPSEVLRDIA